MGSIKINFVFFFCAIILVGAAACTNKFDEHYSPARQINKNIVEILSDDADFSEFVAMIDKAGLRKTLGEAAIYTCLAPTNEQVDAFMAGKGYTSVDDVPEEEIRRFVNYHFINGMYYKYDIEKRYTDAVGGLNPTNATYFTSRTEAKLPGKSIRIFTPAFFAAQQSDYQTTFHLDGGGFRIETAQISDTKYDIDASNGVIHVLDEPLSPLPRTDEAIAGDSETSRFNKWLETQVTYTLGPKDEFGWVDTTLIKSYKVGRNLADEKVLTTVFAPTDAAIEAYFRPYLSDFYDTIDSVPLEIIAETVRNSELANIWYRSDILRNNPELRTTSYPLMIYDIPAHITGSVLASNSVIYKVDKLIEPPMLNSVEGGVYIKKRIYSQWAWMFQHTDLEGGLTDGLYYQHSPKTILLQSDQVWGFPLAEDMETEARDLRYNECRTGILNLDVRADGGFRKRYYPTEFGYILYDNKQFIDYTGKAVPLLTEEPTWERVNGSIYEIGGFLTPMDKLDLTKTVYALIQNDPDYSLFKSAIDEAGLSAELNLTGFFTYTVFAPTDEAIQQAAIRLDAMTPAEKLDFVNAYIVPNRYIFTDGVFQGNVLDKNGKYVTVSGEWDGFSIKSASGVFVKPVMANLQASNGVIHKINQVF